MSGMPAHRGFNGIGNEMQWIRYPRVFRDTSVGKIDGIGAIEINGVLYQCTRTYGPEDLRFFFFIEIDALGITSAFKIKNALVRPAMFIIPDQFTGRISTQCGFTCSAQTKK